MGATGPHGTGGAVSGGSGGASTGGASDAGATATGGTSASGGGAPATGGGSGTGGGTTATGGVASGGLGGGGRAGTGGGLGGGGQRMDGSGGTAGSGEVILVPDPSWTCGMPDGIPPPAAGTLAFTIAFTVGATHDLGATPFGHRRQLDLKGGQISGERLKGSVVSGSLDYELTLSTGAMEIEQIAILKTDDNATVFMRNCGVAAAGDKTARVVMDFEVPSSSTANTWLGNTKLVGTRTVEANAIRLDVYDVSKVALTGAKIQLKDPAGVPNVSWDCVGGSGSKGNSVFTENVTLGSTVSVSGGKRGSRNIIPITGGTTSGKVVGAILNGGADYQLAGNGGTTLDARYTLAPSDGEFIIVRNCGPANALVPVFEARADGPYAFLNQGKFLSSSPGSGAGGVSITFYERK